jgi:hypothetical protein
MAKQSPSIVYEIKFYNAKGRIVKSVTRSIKGVLNNGVVRRIAKEEKIVFNYWVSNIKK